VQRGKVLELSGEGVAETQLEDCGVGDSEEEEASY